MPGIRRRSSKTQRRKPAAPIRALEHQRGFGRIQLSEHSKQQLGHQLHSHADLPGWKDAKNSKKDSRHGLAAHQKEPRVQNCSNRLPEVNRIQWLLPREPKEDDNFEENSAAVQNSPEIQSNFQNEDAVLFETGQKQGVIKGKRLKRNDSQAGEHSGLAESDFWVWTKQPRDQQLDRGRRHPRELFFKAEWLLLRDLQKTKGEGIRFQFQLVFERNHPSLGLPEQ